ncbi:RecQ family ATP-dependent DNA helicase [Bacillus sp. BRMEA1]|uniref:RecQ family ATP-dependent DNA helicase n=1 Tax=Neobacillus endophyticus TaxID=2738405 RepID=UPI001565A579|nr:RecQ family ATP-dependent DNA helicase [Neobacillus endophyticus]NRD80606.1 RecQ family ATP-dependent DNA helicase [Neobacillus endophyticus]
MNLVAELKKYFGFTSFKPGQEEVICSILSGRHTLAMLPTGTGKSLCYQLPGLMVQGHVLIISPLLSLMQDQVEQFKRFGEKRVVALNSFLTIDEKKMVLRNLRKYKFIFISPEMLQVPYIIQKLQELTLSLFVIDEAHCISQWGYDFRPDYSRLGEIRKRLGNPLTLALTATATRKVLNDIIYSLDLEDVTKIEYSVDRPNIALVVEEAAAGRQREERVLELVSQLQKPGIIYFSSKKTAEQMASLIADRGLCKVSAYHAGLDQASRTLIQQQFLYNQLDVICATSAFGMGINKENIRFIIHYHMPMQMESYLQEIGRAGRDGLQSIAFLLYSSGDELLPIQLAESELPSEQQVAWLFHKLEENQMFITDKGIVEQHLRDIGGFSEIQWRIVEQFFKNERHGPNFNKLQEAILTYVKERMRVKKNHIARMKNWIESTCCRREYILQYFEETLSRKISPCCDCCGIELESFQSFAKKHDTLIESTWQEYLSEILINESQNYEK